MRRDSFWRGIRFFASFIVGLVIGAVVSLTIDFLEQSGLISIPTITQIGESTWSVIWHWANIATIRTPESYAINAVILVTIISTIVNWVGRSSESSTLMGIFSAPGAEIWFRIITRMVDFPFIGSLLKVGGLVLRVYFSVFVIIAYLYYAFSYITSGANDLFIMTSSALLASVTFGTVFGRLEKAFVLSIKESAENIRSGAHFRRGLLGDLYWFSMVPVSMISGWLMANLMVSALPEPTFGELLASFTSLFVSTSVSVAALYYIIPTILLVAQSIITKARSRPSAGQLFESIQNYISNYLDREFSKREGGDWYGYPQEVADVLREDFDERDGR